MTSNSSIVLCYHSISDRWPHPLAVTRGAFELQLSRLVQRGYRGTSLDGVLTGTGRRFHVTFDDAFHDVLDAIPILERMSIPATVFAVAGLADGGLPFDVPELAGETAIFGERMRTMSWPELRELADRGFTIGSHTLTHRHLRELGDEELDRELRDSRARVEDELRRPCRCLAYPYGEHDERVRAAAGRAGYTTAFALSAGTDPENRLALPRVDLYRRDTPLRARMKTSCLRPVAKAMLARARALSGA